MDAPTSPAITLRGGDLDTLTGPLVYVWRRGEAVFYVGSSRHGIFRLRDHFRVIPREPTDAIDLYPCASELAARELEIDFILRFRPIKNVIGNRANGDAATRSVVRLSIRQRFAASALGRRIAGRRAAAEGTRA